MFTKWMTGSIAAIAIACSASAQAQTKDPASPGPLTVRADQPGPVINRDIFGQFSEHLGQGIYDGIWVGEKSRIPNVRGIRSDVVKALRDIKVPVVRWPGGCFADRYNWRNGIGPQNKRPVTLNTIWGGATEPNSFGTDEFMDFASQIGAEAYVSVNMGSSTAAEAADWLEYMTTDKPTTLGKLRAANGHPEPYKIKYIGLGNEMWGCGGSMSPANYVEHMKQFVIHVDSQHPDQIDVALLRRSPQGAMRVAVGDGGNGYGYHEAVMKAWSERSPWSWNIEGLSMHNYLWGEKMLNSLATGFGEKEYAGMLKEVGDMEKEIGERAAIMDKYDPKKQVALVVDEWGVWLQPLPGLHPMFLKQQNSMRDAITASMNINIFARRADRVRMANIAQTVNVLQAMILTDGDKMLLTPTYYLFKMYVPFQDATLLPIDFKAGQYKYGDIVLPQVDALAAKAKDGQVWLALTNVDPNRPAEFAVTIPGVAAQSAVGEVLTADRIDSINDFGKAPAVKPKAVGFQAAGGKLVVQLPAKSVTVVRLQP